MPKTSKKSNAPVLAKGLIHGPKDIVTQTDPLWSIILKKVQRLNRVYGFSRIETPILEELQILKQYSKERPGILEESWTTEIGGKNYVIRPTLLPSVLRAYGQYVTEELHPVSKWSYSGNIIKVNDKQALISDYQFGLELFGAFTHLSEAQTIGAIWHLLDQLGLQDVSLEINNVGESTCQLAYQEVLHSYLKDKKFELCDSCNDNLNNKSMNVLRCPNFDCQLTLAEAPSILDYLDETSRKHFTTILEALDELQIPYQLNHLYSGPEGTNRTAFVFRVKAGETSFLIGEGGYHDSLMKQVCGKNFCCFGFSGSLHSIKEAMMAQGIEIQQEISAEVFLVPLGELAAKKSLRLFHDLSAAQVKVYDTFGNVGIKNQLKHAETSKAPIALIMGQKEAMEELVILRDVKSGMQEVFSYDKIINEVQKRLGR